MVSAVLEDLRLMIAACPDPCHVNVGNSSVRFCAEVLVRY